ncbi:PTR2-domain-containing protein [Schizophyllum commune H4-8]|uniref:Peptide transporter PTR2A n=1 Tax=Schizophyllum commune (strain H4-8 / FGSC 9210) TaxID=578458 RepID=D8QHI1_SCHCM|nr:PTR2-domain-containing protein [Schizophyllum commune H4-8]KAI5887196.1 PTR2-domain-containing protein [Schizophyllum commune H4-8]
MSAPEKGDSGSALDEKHSADAVVAPGVGEHYDPDAIVPGSEGVTYHEMDTLRHVSDKINIASFLVIIVEFSERWSYYGTINVLNNYIRAPLPPGSTDGSVLPENRANGIAGALGKGQQVSFSIRTFNSFWFYITPWIGGIIADCWLGRYYTIMLFVFVYLVGHIILVVSATPHVLASPDTSMGLLVLAIIIMGIGGGAIKANVSPMIAEQYTGKMRKKTLKSGEVVVVSPAVTYQRIYNWFYASINWGSAGAISASFLARDHGFWTAFLVPTCILCLVPVVLAAGRKTYVVTPPRGSILLETLRVIKMCLGKKMSWNLARTFRDIRQPGFWDPAKPSSYEQGKVPSNITWDDQFVDEVDRTVKACQVFCALPFFYLCYSQIDGNLSTVAAGMTLNGTPNDLIQNLNPIVIVTMVPILDLLFYPTLRRFKINFTPIKRITTGFMIASLGMLYAAILMKFIYERSPCHDNLPSECTDADGNPNPAPLNVWIVSGPYILVGISELFATLVSNEYAYTKSPKRMKSTVMAFSLFMSAVSALLNLALTAVNVENKFTWLFGSFAVIAFIVGILFFIGFRKLDQEEQRLNVVGLGDRQGFAGESADVTTATHHHGEEKLGAGAVKLTVL